MSLFTVTNQGVITVDTADIKTEFENAYKSALGANLNTDSSSIAGQLITNDTATITTAMAECVAMANENNVYYATGQALDVAASFYGYYRKQGVPTIVVATLYGQEDAIIPTGTKFSDGINEFVSLNKVIIPETGIASVQCKCTVVGPVLCPAGTLTTIVEQVAGLEAVNNQDDGVPGYDTESDNVFRERVTANFLNLHARAILGAIIDNIAAINDVISVVGAENPTNDTQVVSGVTMEPHSIFVTVLGGEDIDIAKVLSQQKTIGAATIGNTVVSYTDSYSGYLYKYNIFRPTQVSIHAQVQYSANEYTPANASDEIISILAEYIQNNPLKVGQTVSGAWLSQAFEEYNKINLLAIKVSTDGETWADYITATKTQVCAISVDNITTTEI